MKYILTLSFLAILVSCNSTLPDQTVYLVRHAEKDNTDQTDNPPLVQEGHDRAQRLHELMEDVNLSKVLSTEYDRNVNTVKPIVDSRGVELEIYEWYEWQGPVQAIKNREGSFLICGHGDNLLPMIEFLGGDKPMEELGEHEYDNLFKVVRKNGQVNVEVIKF